MGLDLYTMSATAYKLSKEEKQRLADRINYFRTMPAQILKTAGDLDCRVRASLPEFVTHDIKSVLVGGRIMLLNCGVVGAEVLHS